MIWNLANSSSELINESTKLDSYFIKSDGFKDVVVDITSALDDTRATKYDAENWSDLTLEQLDAEIPYFDGYISANTELAETSDIAVESVGKNLLGCRIVDGYSWSVAGEKLANPGYVAFDDFVRVLPGTTYTLSKDGTAFPMTVRYYDIEKTNLSSSVGSVSTFATPEKCAYIVAYELHTYSAEENFQLEKGSAATDYEPYVSDTIYLPSGIDLLSINDVTNEYNPRTGILTRRVEKETVTVSSNAATAAKSGTGDCKLFDSYGLAYDGAISGTAVTVTASDGDYTLIYELAAAETEYYYPQEIICRENGTLYAHTDRVTDISFYSDAIYIFDETRPITSLVEVNRVDLADGRLIPILVENCTVAGDGLSFTIDDAEAGDFYDFTYKTDVCVQDPRISVEMTLPVSIGAQVTSVSESMVGLRTRSNEMSTHLGALGRIVTESGVAERDISAVNIENIIHGGVPQIPTVTVHGTTLVNLLGKYGNFETDSNSDGLADGWTKTVSITPTLVTSDKIIGSQSQKLTLVGTATWQYIAISLTDIFVEGHTYYYSQYSKRSNESDSYSGAGYFYKGGTEYAQSLPRPTTAWGKAKRKFIAPSFTTFTLKLYTSGYTSIVENQYVSFDGLQLIDLTAAGALDPVRQQKYGVSNWSDLTEAQLEAEIPYFDSVMSVNVADGTASELTVENRGKNLWNDALCEAVSNGMLAGYGVSFIEKISEHKWYFKDTGNGWAGIRLPVKLDSSKTYRISWSQQAGAGALGQSSIRISFYNSNMNELFGVSARKQDTYTGVVDISISGVPTETEYIVITSSDIYSHTGNVYIENIQLEEGTSATSYVPPRSDSITIPNSVELHGYNGVFNTIDDAGNYVKNWERADKTTDGAGAFALTGYASGSKVICRNKTNGEVEVLDAAASVTTSWTEADIEIIYQLETPVEEGIVIPNSLTLYTGQNNILFPDSKAPAAFNTHIRGQGSIVWDVITMLNNLEARIVELEEG